MTGWPYTEMHLSTLAVKVMDAWASAGLVDGDDTSRQGNEDPEWRKAKLAVVTLLHNDGSVGSSSEGGTVMASDTEPYADCERVRQAVYSTFMNHFNCDDQDPDEIADADLFCQEVLAQLVTKISIDSHS